MKRNHAIVIAVLVVMLTGACGGLREGLRERLKSGRPPLLPRCLPDEVGLARVLAEQIVVEGGATARNVYTVQSTDPHKLFFTSFEMVKTGHEKDPGRILTVASSEAPTPSSSFVAVEEESRKFTKLPHADDGVNAKSEGFVIGRGCVAHVQPL